MFDYYADWCVNCKEMERFTFSDPAVQTALSNVLLLQTDVTANDALDKALVAEFGLFGPPAILFFGPDGRERRELRVVGFMNAGEFRRVVERAVSLADAIRAGRIFVLTEAPGYQGGSSLGWTSCLSCGTSLLHRGCIGAGTGWSFRR